MNLAPKWARAAAVLGLKIAALAAEDQMCRDGQGWPDGSHDLRMKELARLTAEIDHLPRD